MNVVVNITSTLGRKTGIGFYVLELLKALEAEGEIQTETFPRGLLLRLNSLGSRVKNNLDVDHPSRGLTRLWKGAASRIKKSILRMLREMNRFANRVSFRHLMNHARYDLYHEPNYIPYPVELPTVVTIPDLSVLLHPEWHPADRARYFDKYFHQSLPHCAHFLAISESVNREVVEHLGIAPEKVSTTVLGIRDGLCPLPQGVVEAELKRLDLPKKYLLHLGTLEPRKNVLMLMKAYCDLPAAVREEWPLLLVGKWGWATSEMAGFYQDVGRHHNVRHMGYVPDSAMNAIYNGARALVFPSHYEGFGLPPLEMMACGGAVLASRADALVEVAGGHAHHVAADDVEGWRDAMHRVVSEDEWWRQLREGVTEHASTYSWARCASETRTAFERVLSRPTDLKRAA